MAVKVTEPGRTISLVVARQTINGRDFPIRKSKVAAVGDVFPDDQCNPAVLQFAKNGERGLEYVSDSELEQEPEGDAAGGDTGDQPEDYSGEEWVKTKLQAEVEARNTSREDTDKIVVTRADGKDTEPLVTDYQAALVADDQKQAEGNDGGGGS